MGDFLLTLYDSKFEIHGVLKVSSQCVRSHHFCKFYQRCLSRIWLSVHKFVLGLRAFIINGYKENKSLISFLTMYTKAMHHKSIMIIKRQNLCFLISCNGSIFTVVRSSIPREEGVVLLEGLHVNPE